MADNEPDFNRGLASISERGLGAPVFRALIAAFVVALAIALAAKLISPLIYK